MGFMSVLALHSTMSLLKPGGSRHSDESEENFTFHYVSIKTDMSLFIKYVVTPLHSTMSLLKQ